LQQRQHIEWIAIGVFAELAPLVAAVRELASAGVSLADACLAGAPASMRRIAAAPEVRRFGRLAAFVHGAVEIRLPGSDVAIVAAASCIGNPGSFLSTEMVEKLRGPIVDGCILLGAPAASAAGVGRVARVLLRHSSRHVHVLQRPTI
jgi:hypothetical protein